MQFIYGLSDLRFILLPISLVTLQISTIKSLKGSLEMPVQSQAFKGTMQTCIAIKGYMRFCIEDSDQDHIECYVDECRLGSCWFAHFD